jgi:hypothetical protein
VDQAEVALLDEVEEGHPRGLVPLGDRDHQAEVRLDELPLGILTLADEALQVALLGTGEALIDAASVSGSARLDILARLVVLGEELVTTDVLEVQTDQVLVVALGAVANSCHDAFPGG